MKNRTRGSKPVMRAYLREQASPPDENLQLLPGDSEQAMEDIKEVTIEQDELQEHANIVEDEIDTALAPPAEEIEDDSWLEELTPYEFSQPQQPTQAVQTYQTLPEFDTPPDGISNSYSNFEHIDEDVANELDSKMLAPLRSELEKLKALRKQEEARDEAQRLTASNTVITERYPKAEKILRSSEFFAFVNSLEDPYSSDTGFDKLTRAYRAGDGKYVVDKLDRFMKYRGKPTPKVTVEPQQGRVSTNAGNRTNKPKPMTESEYLARRQRLRSLGRSNNIAKALRELAEQYQKSLT